MATLHLKTRAFVAFLLIIATAFAGEAPHITFALPEQEGRITLGIFDSAGKLVRTLHRNAEEGEFTIGLNGLITTWDGKNDAGEVMPAGKYSAHGYVVGDVEVEGEAYHFNDWAEVEGLPLLSFIRDFKLTEEGVLTILGQTQMTGVVAFRLHKDGDRVAWVHEVPKYDGEVPRYEFVGSHSSAPPSLIPYRSLKRLTADEIKVVIYSNEFLEVLDANSGLVSESTRKATGPLDAIATDEKGIIAASAKEKEISWLAIPGFQVAKKEPAPAFFLSMDAFEGKLLGGAGTQGAWLRKGEKWSQVPNESLTNVTSVSFGANETFWAINTSADGGTITAGQYGFNGQFLRNLESESPDKHFESLSASHQGDSIALLERMKDYSGQRLRVMHREAETGQWVIDWEKVQYSDCSNFGIAEGTLVVNAGVVPQITELKFRLSENILTGTKPISQLTAKKDDSGTWLATPDGLRLVEISHTSGIQRVVMQRGAKPDSIRFYQGNGSVVEEFSVTGLHEIAEIEAGDFDWNP